VQNGFIQLGPPVTDVEAVSTYQHHSIPLVDPGGDVSAVWVRAGRRKTSSFSYLVVKRFVDFLVCCAFLPILGPLFVLLAAAVRFSSPGPVFYREQRVGRSGKPFTIYKFRSMYTKKYLAGVLGYDECELTQLRRRQHGKDMTDPRVTRVGRCLRKTSLDELPQLINVLRGEMTLVGPRPVVSAELMSYGNHAFFYKLAVPGITGLWQVSGRSNTTFQERVQLDARYCAEWTPWMDIAILVKTIPAVTKGHGAY
jgi:exopolysaccharide production protein ExoY